MTITALHPTRHHRGSNTVRRSTRRPNVLSFRRSRFTAQDKNRPARILLAYSGAIQREYLAVALASRGYEVHACANGTAALSRFATDHYDAIITGIVMPHLDGLELLRELRRRRGGVPVIVVTDGTDGMDQVYRRCATLIGAFAVHTICETWGLLMQSLEWTIQGRSAAIHEIVW
jgi:CheY-like chemotaxis protein